MRLPNPLHAVIFDMDGTLHDTEQIYDIAQRRTAAEFGCTITDAFWHSLIGVPGVESNAMLGAQLGPEIDFDGFNRTYHAYREELLAEAVPLKPGVHELLDDLQARGLKIALATSASRSTAETHLTRSGLRSRFEITVTSSDVDRGKPHPDPFLLAARHLGLAPANCIVVEDAFTGIRGAHAAGTMPILVPDILIPTPEISALCVAVLVDLHEVRALIQN